MTTHSLRTAALLLLACGSLASTGCRGGGDLISNPHQVTPRARCIANHMPAVAAVPRELGKAPLPDVYVQPGDSLLLEPIVATAAPIVATDQVVAADGSIDLGLYGRVRVAGATVEEIEDRIREAVCSVDASACDPPDDLPDDPDEAAVLIAQARRGPVNVRLVAADSLVFYVLGEVAAPGAYPLDGRETVLDAILEAGGLSARANRCEIILARPTGPHECRVVMQVCYDRLVQLGDTTTNYQVLPGDRIFVASKTYCESMRDVVCFWEEEGCPHCCDTGSFPCPCPTGPEAVRRPFLPLAAFPRLPIMESILPSRPASLPPAAETDAADSEEPHDSADTENDTTPADAGDTKRSDASGADSLRLERPTEPEQPAIAAPGERPPITLPPIDLKPADGGQKPAAE